MNAISVDSIGKKYLITKNSQVAKYNSLREILQFNPFSSSKSSRKEEFWALKDVSFSISKGERVAIIGSNGAGKSTLLKILSRITPPSRGRAEINGRIASLLEVGTGFHPELTGRENIFLNGSILGLKRRDINDRLDEIVEFAGVTEFINTPVKRYSSGMYMRLAFAVAAHLDPEILIVDEVLAVGDASFQKKCLSKMNNISKEGKTILFVSHNMTAVRNLCERGIVLKMGEVAYDGNVSSAIENYFSGDQTSNAVLKWETPPSNNIFKLKSVSVLDDKNNETNLLPNDKPLYIEFKYDLLETGRKAGATLLVLNDQGDILFSSMSNHETNWHNKSRPQGTFISKCKVPENLLLEGRYTVSVILWAENFGDSLRVDSGLSFQVYDTGTLRGDYYGGWAGLVKPKLEWTCTKVDKDE